MIEWLIHKCWNNCRKTANLTMADRVSLPVVLENLQLGKTSTFRCFLNKKRDYPNLFIELIVVNIIIIIWKTVESY